MAKRKQEQDYYYDDETYENSEYDEYAEYYSQPKFSLWSDVIKPAIIIVAVIFGLAFIATLIKYNAENNREKGYIKDPPSTPQTSQQTTNPSTTKPSTTNPSTTKPAEKSAADIIDINIAMGTNSIGTTHMQVAFIIENTGNTNLYLESSSFDVETVDGELVTSVGYVEGYPQVLAPGEKGVYFKSFSNERFDTTQQYKVVPYLSVKKATVKLIRFEYSDIKIQEGSYGIYIDVLGRIHNNTSEDESMARVAMICYDKQGKVIDVIYSYKDYAAGEKKGFEISHNPSIDFSIDDIASYDFYVYPYQYQFN